ncbi:hypothetical protein CPter291_0320 [Collimonas pratensis]|uniref:Lipoprotein n=1 Tax=Collimonas pratensis TaxID=279113 RepID=A0ABN4M542_9BURK|nr:hypothetical protein CPter291_0320 [Collimonas pratensis]
MALPCGACTATAKNPPSWQTGKPAFSEIGEVACQQAGPQITN